MKVIDALIVLIGGWRTEDEKELSKMAMETLLTEKEKIVLQYKKEKVERELFELEEQLDIPGVMRYHNRQSNDMNGRENALFLRWILKHYSTKTTDDGFVGYVDSMDRDVDIETIINHYKQSN